MIRHLAPILTAAALAGAAGGASAQKVQPPAGCTAFLTVQSRGCNVTHYWRCEAGPEGASWAASYDADGPVSLSLYDREFQWLDSQYLTSATREYLLGEAADPASMSELLETGRDTYDFVIREDGPDGTRDVRHVGYDELAGGPVTINGEELLQTVFSSTASDAGTGEEIYTVTGRQYVLAEERLFFLGADTFVRDGDEVTSDGSPVRILRPGDIGFGATTPTYDCNAPTDIGLFRPAAGPKTEETRDDL
jgi:hypothetical protein